MITVSASALHAQSHYYYSEGEAIELYVDSTRVLVKFDEGLGTNQQATILSQIQRIDSGLTDNHTFDGFSAFALSTSQGYFGFIDSVESIDGVYGVEPYYVNDIDSAFTVGTRFCVAFDEGVSGAQIDSINAQFGVVIDHEVEGH